MKRLILLLSAILLLSGIPLFAGGSSEAISEESWILEHSTVNNDNKYWDVSEALAAATPAQQYAATSDSGLLRVRTNYGRTYTDSKYRKVTIEPVGGGWEFVSDNNATVTRAYTFELYKIGWTRSSATSTTPTASGSPAKVTPGTNNASEYSFTMDSATWTYEGNFITGRTYYTSKFYDYEVVLVLPELSQAEKERLEPGDYHATFKVSLYIGSDGGSLVSQTYTIKAVYGETSGGNTEYAFTVGEASATYNVDLSNVSSFVDVASLSFHAVGLSTENKEKSQIENSYKNKYKVLISPYSQYNLDNTSSDNPYMFILNGSDNLTRTEINTVWYTLASSSSGTALNLYDGNNYKHTYVLTPTLEVTGTKRNWVLNWDLSQDIYLKPSAPTTTVTQANGFYHTTLYFYVVTNT